MRKIISRNFNYFFPARRDHPLLWRSLPYGRRSRACGLGRQRRARPHPLGARSPCNGKTNTGVLAFCIAAEC